MSVKIFNLKKYQFGIILFAIILLHSNISLATQNQSIVYGKDIINKCVFLYDIIVKKKQYGVDEIFAAGECSGYIEGLIEVKDQPNDFCVDDIDRYKVAFGVLIFLMENEKLIKNEDAYVSTILALKKKFPCKNEASRFDGKWKAYLNKKPIGIVALNFTSGTFEIKTERKTRSMVLKDVKTKRNSSGEYIIDAYGDDGTAPRKVKFRFNNNGGMMMQGDNIVILTK